MLSLFLIFSFISVFAQKENVIALTPEAKRHWDNAMIYKEEAKNFSENELIINELEKLIAIQDFPDAYLELGKLYGKGYVLSWIKRSHECFKKYVELCPDKRNVAEEENSKCETFRNLRKMRFEKKLVGKWYAYSDYFGEGSYCFEVNSDGTVRVPYEYSNYVERVTDWQTIPYDFWTFYSDNGVYMLTQFDSTQSKAFRLRYIGKDGINIIYHYIAFLYQENVENESDNELICYVNQTSFQDVNSWIFNESRKVVFYKEK